MKSIMPNEDKDIDKVEETISEEVSASVQIDEPKLQKEKKQKKEKKISKNKKLLIKKFG